MSKRGMAHLIMFLAVAAIGVASMIMYVNTEQATGQVNWGYQDPFYPYGYVPGQRDVDYKMCRSNCYAIGDDRYAPYRYDTQACLNQCAYWQTVPDWRYQQGPSYWYDMGVSPDTTQQGALVTGYFAVPSANKYGGEIKGIMDSESRAFAGRAVETEPLSCFTCSCGTKYSTSSKAGAEQACKDVCGGSITTETPGACQ